jgi:hypothetical protein
MTRDPDGHYHGTGGETSEGILPVTTQPEEAATTEGFIRWVAGFDIGLPVENEDAAVFDYYRAIVRKARDHTRTLDPTPSDAPQEGRHPDVKRLASWLRGSYGHAFPRVDWEADAAEVLDLFASDYSAPQEGRPTTPQTEAPEFWFAQGPLIHGRDRGGIDIGPLIGEARTDASARSLVEHHNAMVRAAAGALPSVPLEEREDFKVGFHRGVRVGYLRGKRAAPPEASER